MKRVLVVIAAAGCAQGSRARTDDAQVDAPKVVDVQTFDARVIDAPMIDAPMIDAPMIDAPMIDAPMIDAPMIDAPMIDAPPPDACVPYPTQLLANPVFDLDPKGTGWQQTVIDPLAPLVTDEDGIAEHTAPYKAWLGGIEATSGSVTDVLFQDVVIPANTTELRLTGVYEVRSGESATDTNVYDVGSLSLVQTNGTPIATILALNNTTRTTQWTPIAYTFAANLSGQTVRLRMTTSNDFLNATSFYFDTLALTAMHCP